MHVWRWALRSKVFIHFGKVPQREHLKHLKLNIVIIIELFVRRGSDQTVFLIW